MTNGNNAIEGSSEPTAQTSKGSSLAFGVGFYFTLRIVATVFLVRVVGTEPQLGAEVILILNFFLLALVCLSVVGSSGVGANSNLQLANIRWVLIFLGFSGCSLLWSATISKPVSAAYWCGTVSDVAIMILLLRSGLAQLTAHSLMKGFVWGGCCVAIIAWVMPVEYDMRLGDEDYLNPNTIGNICAFAIFFAQYLMRAKKGRWGLVIAFLGITLVRSLSKTAIAAFLISEGYLIIRDRVMSRRTKVSLLIGVILVVLIFWNLIAVYYDFYTSYGNQSETLTGRAGIWAYVVDEVPAKLWIGHGFDSMWKVVPVFGTFEARHAENEVLEQLYCYGVIGLVILCGTYGSLYWKIRKHSEGSLRIIFFVMLIFVLIRGLAEAEPFDLLLPLWAIVLMTSLMTCNDAVTKPGFVITLTSDPDDRAGRRSMPKIGLLDGGSTVDVRS